jgi:hypothetical protein
MRILMDKTKIHLAITPEIRDKFQALAKKKTKGKMAPLVEWLLNNYEENLGKKDLGEWPEIKKKLILFADRVTGGDVVKLFEEVLANDENSFSIILKIPSRLKGDKEGLKRWLDSRSSALVNVFCKDEDVCRSV